MSKNREGRRTGMVATNGGVGLSRRRHRIASSIRDSSEDDGPVELQETAARLRERPVKKEGDRDRERYREGDRSGRSKRRRSDKFIAAGRGDEGVDDSSEGSVNDEDDEDPDDRPVRYAPPNPVPMMPSSTTTTPSLTNHHHNHPPRKAYLPPQSKVFRPVVPTWKTDEMIGVSIPRKARSASTKRSHETWSCGGGFGEPTRRQPSSSPVRSSVVSAQEASPSTAPVSPSSSSGSMKKKLPNGQKQKPPKSSSKSSPSMQDEIEIEVAEVLYGLMWQSQGPAKPETAMSDQGNVDSREISNRSNGDSKSRVSSPTCNSASVVHPHPSPSSAHNSSSVRVPLTIVAPKRKRPRPVSYEEENKPVFIGRERSGQHKVESDQVSKQEDVTSPRFGKSSRENGGVVHDVLRCRGRTGASVFQMQPETMAVLVGESERRDQVTVKMEEEASVSTNEFTGHRLNSGGIKDSTKGNHVEEKFEIDVMAPPPPLRASPESEGPAEYRGVGGAGAEEAEKSVVADRGAVVGGAAKHSKAGGVQDGEKVTLKVACGDGCVEVKNTNNQPPSPAAEEADPQVQLNLGKHRSAVDFQLDLEKVAVKGLPNHSDVVDVEKMSTQLSKQLQQQQKITTRDDANNPGQSSSLQLQMSVADAAAAAGWPGGLPPMGYVAPLQGVVSVDGTTMSAAPTTQPRPKRCAMHCYVARNIQCHQQFMKMNPFWPAAAAAAAAAVSVPLFAAPATAPCNLNMVPHPADLQGNVSGRVQDVGHTLSFFPGQPASKEKVPYAAATVSAGDGAKNNQSLLEQSLPSGPPTSILHGPAFIFPLGQQQAAAAAACASAWPSSLKSAATASGSGTSTAGSTPATATSTVPAVPPAMSFNLPNFPANETQYLAILGNGAAYPFPIPAHIGAPSGYKASHAQAMPFFNGSFYPPQMLHPSQLLQGHQNTSGSNAGASSQKHVQDQQQRPQGAAAGGGNSNPSSHSFQTPKSHASTQPTQHEMGNEESPSTADRRASRPSAGVYGPNFTVPVHPPNFLFTQGALATATSGSANTGEKKQQKRQSSVLKSGVEFSTQSSVLKSGVEFSTQSSVLKSGVEFSTESSVLKSGVEFSTPQPFVMPFAYINGTTPGLDISTMAHNHAILQSLPEAARNNYQIMAAATAAQSAHLKAAYRTDDDGKSGVGDSSNGEEERKPLATRTPVSVGHGQSLAFTRSGLPVTSVSIVSMSNVVDSSNSGLNLVPGSVHASRPSAPSGSSNASGSGSQQQPQMLQHQKQHQYAADAAAAGATRGKTPTTGHGIVYPDHPSSSPAMAAKFPNSLSSFPPSVVPNSAGKSQSSQWKKSWPPSPQVSSSSAAAMKNLPQHENGPQQSHTQTPIGANNPKSPSSQAQRVPNSHQSTSSISPPRVGGSPSTSSISKGAGSSARTTASPSSGNKASQAASSLSSHPGKNSSSIHSQKSSPSMLGRSPHLSTPSGKPQLQQSHPQQQPQLLQPQLSKQAIQQTQLYFSNAYPQPSPNGNSASSASAAGGGGSGYYLQRHRQDQPQAVQKSQGSAPQTSSGILSLSPVSLTGVVNTDPAKAMVGAAAVGANNSMKGGMLSQGILHAAQFSGQHPTTIRQVVPAGFPHVGAVTVKAADQKQPVGNGRQTEKK